MMMLKIDMSFNLFTNYLACVSPLQLETLKDAPLQRQMSDQEEESTTPKF